MVAYLLAVALGVGAGLLIGGVRHLHDVLNPFLVVLYAPPKTPAEDAQGHPPGAA